MYYWEAIEAKNKVESAINGIPLAELKDITCEAKNSKNFRAVVVEGEMVSVIGKKYNLVQHKDAFMPIIDALHSTGTEFKMNLWNNKTTARMNIFTEDIQDTVSIGFQVANSVDGKSSLRIGIHAHYISKKWIELVGYRQICINGMKIRVPLDEAEIVKPEERVKIETLFNKSARFIHTVSIEHRLEEMTYITEAISLLRKPVSRMIDKAEAIKINPQVAEDLIKKYITRRKNMKKQIIAAFGTDSPTLWGLYNAITFVASHNTSAEKTSRIENLLTNSADMLLDEIKQ